VGGAIEDAYEALLEEGLDTAQAWEELARQIPDWTI
jgi:hypothetical protein